MSIPDEVKAKIRDEQLEESELKCVGPFIYVVYKEIPENSASVYCFVSSSEPMRKLVCSPRVVKKFQEGSDSLYRRLNQLLRLSNNRASSLLFDLIEMADSIQKGTFQPLHSRLPISTRGLSDMQSHSISIIISRLLMCASYAGFMYERRSQWIIQCSYLRSWYVIHRYLQWEITANGFLAVSMINGFERESDIDDDGDGMIDFVDDTDQHTIELMQHLRHDLDDGDLSGEETDDGVRSQYYNNDIPPNWDKGMHLRPFVNSLLQLDAKLQGYCKF